MSPFDEARHISQDKASAVFKMNDAQVRYQGGERIIGGLDVGPANDVQEGGFSDARETDKPGIR